VQHEAVIVPEAWAVYLYSELGMMKSPSILLATNYSAVNAKISTPLHQLLLDRNSLASLAVMVIRVKNMIFAVVLATTTNFV